MGYTRNGAANTFARYKKERKMRFCYFFLHPYLAEVNLADVDEALRTELELTGVRDLQVSGQPQARPPGSQHFKSSGILRFPWLASLPADQHFRGRSYVKYRERSPKFNWGSMCTVVLIGWDPATTPPPPHLGSYTSALFVSQDRRHLFVTP